MKVSKLFLMVTKIIGHFLNDVPCGPAIIRTPYSPPCRSDNLQCSAPGEICRTLSSGGTLGTGKLEQTIYRQFFSPADRRITAFHLKLEEGGTYLETEVDPKWLLHFGIDALTLS